MKAVETNGSWQLVGLNPKCTRDGMLDGDGKIYPVSGIRYPVAEGRTLLRKFLSHGFRAARPDHLTYSKLFLTCQVKVKCEMDFER